MPNESLSNDFAGRPLPTGQGPEDEELGFILLCGLPTQVPIAGDGAQKQYLWNEFYEYVVECLSHQRGRSWKEGIIIVGL